MAPPPPVLELIERFDRNRDAYKSPHYNETQLRREFLDPLFKALGWDMDNAQGYAEAYKDVVHEDAIKVGEATKAPDYCFRIGGTRKFFLEAKRPSVDIKNDVSPAYQLRRYAWTTKLPLSILTDFEEFAVYDCRLKPDHKHSAAIGRILYIPYTEYAQRWDELAGVFSRDAVLKGSFDKFADSTKARGTADVDEEFLKTIETWRSELARNLALRNPKLSQRELNFAVQRIIDRIIFLRIGEGRGIEDYGRLRALTNGDRIYPRLCQLFEEADTRYNSGLFHFKPEKGRHEAPDELTLALDLDDKLLRDIIKGLYYPESPYVFSALPADILGQVYEQFLGKIIRLTEGHRAVVEEKPEVKKAGGVYYTPTYVVDYIVQTTVGQLLEGKTPKQAAKLKILDPACGSGSFLIGAYEHLLKWHRDFYTKHNPERWAKGAKPVLVQVGPGNWKLTIAERKRILLDNIFGVDIDAQAVETTKLSLLLKVLEGETQQSLQPVLRFFHERALPDLGDNIKCGNSLIGPDFYQQQQLLDDEERYRINVFDWAAEFPDVFNVGGFNAVIGNPPYLRIQGLQQYYGNQISYLCNRYESASKRFDFYMLFLERGFKLLTKGGRLAFICPHKFTNGDFASNLRGFLSREKAIKRLLSFGQNLVFPQATTYTGIVLLVRGDPSPFLYAQTPEAAREQLPTLLQSYQSDSMFTEYAHTKLGEAPWTLTTGSAGRVLRKLAVLPDTIGTVFAEVLVGVQSGIDDVHVLSETGKRNGSRLTLFSERDATEVVIEEGLAKTFAMGEDVHRYAPIAATHRCLYPYRLEGEKTRILVEDTLRRDYPLGYAHLKRHQPYLAAIRQRQKTNPLYWYSCHRSRDMRVFEQERIVTPEISKGCNMTLAHPGLYHNTQVYSLVPGESVQETLLFWLGILNSKVLWWFLQNTGNVLRGGYFRFKTDYLNPFPLPRLDLSKAADKSRHDQVANLAEQMLALHERLSIAKTPQEQTALERQIAATDTELDKLVYALYGLTEDEIEIVEAAAT